MNSLPKHVKHLKTRHKAGQCLSVELAEHFKQSGAPLANLF